MNVFGGRIATIVVIGIVTIGLMIVGCNPDPEEVVTDPNIDNIRLTEIHYHPVDFDGINGDSLEFIEIKNVGSETVNLGALVCTDGIDFDFPNSASVAAGGFFVVASNKGAFEERYGFNPDGVYSGQLSNSGERIKITDMSSDEIIISQTYADNGAWPGEADGGGYSLVPIKANPAPGDTAPSDWRGSSSIGGSPGKNDEKKSLDSALLNLRITEIHYHPDYIDSIGSDSLEFIELKNVGSTAIALTGVIFTSGVDYAFPSDSVLKPGAFCVLASNAKWFKTRYGFKAFGGYNGQLRNSADTITVVEIKSGTMLLSIAYSDHSPWSAYADGNGWSLVTKNADPALYDENNPAAWTHSLRINGSPGSDDPGPVYVNEVLPHTDPPLYDAVELYNPNATAIDLGNWFISDNLDDPMKFRIPAGTSIPAGGYRVFDEFDFNSDTTLSTSFRFSEYGEDVYLFADSIGKRGYYHGFTFGPIDNGVSFGRYFTSDGIEEFVAQTTPSLREANKGPAVGPIVFTEIMYSPADTLSQFVEIKNISADGVLLYDELNPSFSWRIKPVDSSLPANVSLKAGEVALFVAKGIPFDTLKSRYSIPDSVQVFTMTGTLDNASDSLSILKPHIDSGSLTLPELPYVTVDRVVYKNSGKWPAAAGGKSLQRIDPEAYGNDPANWKAADPGAGK
jgi:hypothetical protein